MFGQIERAQVEDGARRGVWMPEEPAGANLNYNPAGAQCTK